MTMPSFTLSGLAAILGSLARVASWISFSLSRVSWLTSDLSRKAGFIAAICIATSLPSSMTFSLVSRPSDTSMFSSTPMRPFMWL